MRTLACSSSLLLLMLVIACGDDDGTNPDAGADAGDAAVGDGGTDTGPDTSMPDAGEEDVGPDVFDAGPMCLDVTDLQGEYDTDLDGTCDSLIDFAEQMIDPTVGGGPCDITFSSIMAKGSLGVNGTVTVDEDGNFEDTELELDSMPQTCSGAWDAGAGTMTLTCPDCTLTLTLITDAT